MPDTAARLQQLREEAEAAVRAASSSAELDDVRVRFLGRRSELTGVLRSIRDLPPEERGSVGQVANSVREAIEAQLAERGRDLERLELDPYHLCRPCRRAELVGGDRVPEHGHAGDLGERFLEEFEVFAGDLDLLEEQAGDLLAWSRQPRNVP